MFALFSFARSECYPACPPWQKKCSKICMPQPWYQQEYWADKLIKDDKFRLVAVKYFLEKEAAVDHAGKCYPGCPPWATMCNRRCYQEPWYLQAEWKKALLTDPKIRLQAVEHFLYPVMALTEDQPENAGRVCYPACAPWEKICPMSCADRPWFEQEKYVKLMAEDPKIKALAMKYFARNSEEEEEVVAQQTPCYPACAPWEKICPMSCADRPWFEQPKYVKLMAENPRIKALAMKYFARNAAAEEVAIQQTPCYPACAPWEKICPMSCADRPWFKQEKYVKLMAEDPKIKALAMKYFARNEAEIEKEEVAVQQAPCYPACAPWEKVCPMSCADRPWFEQEKYVKLMAENPRIKALAMKYFARNQEEERKCYSACAPWELVCPRICMDVPWYLQPKYQKLLKEDPEFRAKAMPYFAR